MQAGSASTLAAAGNDFSGRLEFDSAGGLLFSTLAALLDHSARRAVASAQPAVQPEARIILRTHSENSQVKSFVLMWTFLFDMSRSSITQTLIEDLDRTHLAGD
eukprot:12473-Heterococcus_DN1.PRE.5